MQKKKKKIKILRKRKEKDGSSVYWRRGYLCTENKVNLRAQETGDNNAARQLELGKESGVLLMSSCQTKKGGGNLIPIHNM